MTGNSDVAQFLQRIFKQSLRKAATLILADKEFAEDLKDSASLEDYLEFIASKKKRTIAENLFFLLPDEDQKNLWTMVKGVHNERKQ